MLDKNFWTDLAKLWVKDPPKSAPVEKIELEKDNNKSFREFLNSIDDEDI